jgi:hypothetical protein
MHTIWNGKEPANRSPEITGAWLDSKAALQNVRLQPGQRYTAKAAVEDPDRDPLNFSWEIMPESTDLKSGGDWESKPKSLPELIANPKQGEVELTAPAKPGAYRLYVYAYDGQGHAAHANIPFFVEGGAPSTPAGKR